MISNRIHPLKRKFLDGFPTKPACLEGFCKVHKFTAQFHYTKNILQLGMSKKKYHNFTQASHRLSLFLLFMFLFLSSYYLGKIKDKGSKISFIVIFHLGKMNSFVLTIGLSRFFLSKKWVLVTSKPKKKVDISPNPLPPPLKKKKTLVRVFFLSYIPRDPITF